MDHKPTLHINHFKESITLENKINLSPSKSESNRALIIAALQGKDIQLDNLSDARDTQTMQALLSSTEKILNVLDAGTTMRFLTAYLSIQKQERVITGTPRMQERPIKILVDALSQLGAEIQYEKKEGFPPLRIFGMKKQKTSRLSIRGDVSSQYISALLMIAPYLEKGLVLQLEGKVNSLPYIEMTLGLMKQFGIQYTWEQNTISIARQAYQAGRYTIESDWSGASYWFTLVGLAPKGSEIYLSGLKENSYQGDQAIREIMMKLGVTSNFTNQGLALQQGSIQEHVAHDFRHCPDLAQTVASYCAVKGIAIRMTGLESLRIKETDRVQALQNELGKLGARFDFINENDFTLIPGTPKVDQPWSFTTYEDHRMALALAPLACLNSVIIEEPEVINKSYPRYWDHLKQIGFQLKFQD